MQVIQSRRDFLTTLSAAGAAPAESARTSAALRAERSCLLTIFASCWFFCLLSHRSRRRSLRQC